ncbi:MAG: DUF134 domain-containing protein [Firmicutes bacterium]|nr:DUF134 domain-containing protein [Bacillota bacterium]
MAPRPRIYRIVESEPLYDIYKPAGVPMAALEEVVLTVEQLEALRLKDLEGLEQEACAELMQVSRPTFQRVLARARETVARALVEGKALRIEGGHYLLRHQVQCRRHRHGKRRHGGCGYCGPSGRKDS